MLQRNRQIVPLGKSRTSDADVLQLMLVDSRTALWSRRSIAGDHDDRHAVAARVVDRHRRMLEADRAVAQHIIGFPATLK